MAPWPNDYLHICLMRALLTKAKLPGRTSGVRMLRSGVIHWPAHHRELLSHGSGV